MAKDINYNSIDIDFIIKDCISAFAKKIKPDKKKKKEAKSDDNTSALEKKVKKEIKEKTKVKDVENYIEVSGKKSKAGVNKDGFYHMGF
jgi:hypothetical protein